MFVNIHFIITVHTSLFTTSISYTMRFINLYELVKVHYWETTVHVKIMVIQDNHT